MKLSHRAALRCTTRFPGAGYFLLGQKTKGWGAFLLTLVALAVVMRDAFFKANRLSEQILAGEMTFDPVFISQQLLQGPSLYSPEVLSLLTYSFLAFWLITALDCYRIGKHQESLPSRPS